MISSKSKFENREEKQEALTAVKQNTALVQGMTAQIDDIVQRTASLRELLVGAYGSALPFFGADFRGLSASQQSQLVALVNATKACAALLGTRIQRDCCRFD